MRELMLDAEQYRICNHLCSVPTGRIVVDSSVSIHPKRSTFCEIPNNPTRITSVSSDVWEIILFDFGVPFSDEM